jgi:hypothetical protein
LAHLGHTSEDVSTAIVDGSFGMWKEIGSLNQCLIKSEETSATERTLGDRFRMWLSEFPNSILGECFLPPNPEVTIHHAVGQDVFCQHSNYDATQWGQATYNDFLSLASFIEHMQGGTFLCFGSAVAAPEIFLKALSMARNVNDGKPDDLAVAVFDCVPIPRAAEAAYFNRPAKTLLGRVAKESIFVRGRHEATIPNLWKALCWKDEQGCSKTPT